MQAQRQEACQMFPIRPVDTAISPVLLIGSAHRRPPFVRAAWRMFNRLSLVLPQTRAMQVREAQSPKDLDNGRIGCWCRSQCLQ